MLAALVLLATATAGQAQQVVLKSGDTIPNLRACVDHIGRGTLKPDGSTPIDDPDDILGHSIYHFRFDSEGWLFGIGSRRFQRLAMAGHALRQEPIEDAVVFLSRMAGNTRFVAWQRVWHDTVGRPFIPIFWLPGYVRDDSSWWPQATRQMMKRVHYSEPQSRWRDQPALGADDEEPGLVETHNGRTRVLYGLYLSDLPALMRTAVAEPCWR